MSDEGQGRAFVCQQCGVCCRWEGHVLLTEEDIARMAAELKLSEDAFIEQYTLLADNRRQLSLTEYPDGRCIFLGDNHCLHYAVRPEQCRSFPHAWRVTEGCPALDKMDKDNLKR